MFRSKTGSVPDEDENFVPPRAQKYSRYIGQQIKIEINQQAINQEEL
jgi:hypothetical protein